MINESNGVFNVSLLFVRLVKKMFLQTLIGFVCATVTNLIMDISFVFIIFWISSDSPHVGSERITPRMYKG